MIVLYRFLGYVLLPFVLIYLKWRAYKGREDPARLVERHGHTSIPRPLGKLVWVHAASIGESLSALTIIKEMREELPTVHILLTTGTLSSAELMKERLPKDTIHQYFPLDLTPWVKRFINHWCPDLVLWLESELWPAHLSELRYRRIPTILLNARLSKSTFKRWGSFPYYFKKLTSLFDKIFTWSVSDEKKFHQLGVTHATFQGNLKTIEKPLVFDEEKRDLFMKAVNHRPVWVAASTHAGEEDIIADVHKQLQKDFLHALCLLIPRHPDRAKMIQESLKHKGYQTQCRTVFEYPDEKTDIYIADTLGELDLFYQIAPISFVGGSLIPVGGHNIIEAVRADSLVIVGPYTSNFQDIIEEFVHHGACIQVKDKEQLTQTVKTLLLDPEKRKHMSQKARQLLGERSLLLEKIMTLIRAYLGVKQG